MVKDLSIESQPVQYSSDNEKKEEHILKRTKPLGLKLDKEDLFLTLLLFLLIEESVEDEFLILMVIILILTDKD